MAARTDLEKADFTPAGQLAELRSYYPDGIVKHAAWTYDGAGRVLEIRRWPDPDSAVLRCEYDPHGQPLRTIQVTPDGKEQVVESWGSDEQGRRSRVQFTGGPIEPPGRDFDDPEMLITAYGVDKAVTLTSIYDSENRIAELRHHDASHNLLFTLTVSRDEHGRIAAYEGRFAGLGLGAGMDEALANASEQDRAQLQKVMEAALDEGRFDITTYERDAEGRILTSTRRIGSMDEARSTFAYDDRANVVEKVESSRSANVGLDDTGLIVRRESPETVRRFTYDYVYDEKRNWIERMTTVHEPTIENRSRERRSFTYYA